MVQNNLKQEPLRILLIRLSSLGDVVLTLPLPFAIKRCYPGAQVDLLVRDDLASIAASAPYDSIIPFNKRQAGGISGLRKFASRLSGDYTHVIDLHSVIRTRLISRAIHAPHKSRYHKQSIKRYALLWLRVNTYGAPVHVIDRYRMALNRAGLYVKRVEHHIELPFAQMGRVDEIRQGWDVGWGTPVIGIMAGAARVNRQWFRERFARVADDLVAHYGARIILLGGEKDGSINHHIRQMMVANAIDLAGKTALGDLPSTIAALDLLITNETGIMHLGYILGIPMISIFGPAASQFGFAPIRPQSIIFESEIPCRPCSIHGEGPCYHRDLECLNRTTADMVTRAAQILLNRVGFRPLEFPEELR
jgi:heptosyltransferase-2